MAIQGVVSRCGKSKSTTCSICGPYQALRGKESSLIAIFDVITALTTNLIKYAYILKSVDYCVDNDDNDNNDRADYSTSCACE